MMQGASMAGRKMSAWLVLLGIVTGIAQADPITLQQISHNVLPGEGVKIRLDMSDEAPMATSFTTENPARIALDLPGVVLGDISKSQTIGVGNVRGLQAIEAAGRTRVVINLIKPLPYHMETSVNSLYLIVGQGAQGEAAAEQAEGEKSSGAEKKLGHNQLDKVDFRRGEQGEGRIIIDLSSSNIIADISEEGGKLVVEFLSTSLPEELERRLNVLDFATPVRTVDTFTYGNNVRMEISALGKYEHMAYQTGQTLTIEVQPIAEPERAAHVDEEFTGEKLSLNFQNIEVRAVLQLLADFTGMNMVTSDSVGGNITLRLKNVPWDQALDIILRARGLGMRKSGDVVMIAPSEELAENEKRELEAQKQLQELSPLVSDSIQINYAKAGTLADLLKSDDNSLLSDRGSVTIDERTNRLLVKDTRENLLLIRKLVSELDIPIKQVLIDSRIVLATDNFNKELGARFGVSGTERSGRRSSVVSGNLEATEAISAANSLYAPGRYNVNLPLNNQAKTGSGGTIGLALAKLPLGTLLELELSAAQAEGKTEVISSPRVITSNQKEAVIEQGVEIPYQEQAGGMGGGTSVTFKKAVLSLRVTPQITPDDRIIMDLQVNKDKPDFSRAVLGQPPIDTQNVTTQVLVDNGETVVLGGVYEQNKESRVERVPFFSELPLLGMLFRNNYTADEKSELLIFVTPKIMKEMAKLD